MNEEKIVTLLEERLIPAMEKKLIPVMEERLIPAMEKRLVPVIEDIVDKKLDEKLDKKFDEFYTKISHDVTDNLEMVISTSNNNFNKIYAKLSEHSKVLKEHSDKLDEHSKILNEHSKILNQLVVFTKTTSLKNQSYDAELGKINTKLFEHETRIDNLEEVNLQAVN